MIQQLAAPTFAHFVSVFARIGCLSFGGPAGQIALMHRELIDERQWVDEGGFLRALNFCHLLPGPEAQQLATYIGWRMFGLRGGLVAGILFIIPGALVMLGLSLLYVQATGLSGFEAAMGGVKVAVIAIVVQALIRIARRALKSRIQIVLAITAFLALFLFDLPFPLVIAFSALVGMLNGGSSKAPTDSAPPAPARHLVRQSLSAVMVGGLLWAAPIALILATLGPDHLLAHIATFFSKLAVVTFGGAYAVLAYMAQAAVQDMGWLSAGQMADGLGLAETTPGPLILVTQFVGFLGAWNAPAPFTPVIAAILASLIVLWVTFVPCFMWIFAFAPWIERLEHARRLHAALSGVTAAVVGVIANLALWFALHVLFTRVTFWTAGPIRTQMPDLSSFDPVATALAAGALILMLRFGRGPVTVLGLAVMASVAMRLVVG